MKSKLWSDVRPLVLILIIFIFIGGVVLLTEQNGLLPKEVPTLVTGSVILYGLPSEAQVSVNNQVETETRDLTPGSYNFVVSAPGYYNREFRVLVKAGKTVQYQVELDKLDPKKSSPLVLLVTLIAFCIAFFAGIFSAILPER